MENGIKMSVNLVSFIGSGFFIVNNIMGFCTEILLRKEKENFEKCLIFCLMDLQQRLQMSNKKFK